MTDLHPHQKNTIVSTNGFPALLYGVLLTGTGFGFYFIGVSLGFLRIFLDPAGNWKWIIELIIWHSGIPVVAGLVLIALELSLLLPKKRIYRQVLWLPPTNSELTVVLTAYNDEASIGLAVADFLRHQKVKRVLVVDNNSKDSTAEVAARAGALVIQEENQGYGFCVWRALYEASRFPDTDLTLLCEGDMTFRAFDIDKFLSYVPHADIVNGTRIVEQLREGNTQLTTFMFYGNFFVGKLLEAKHIGKGTFTDVGTTYKLCKNEPLKELLPHLNPKINLEFNAYFLDSALAYGLRLVECPITFHKRVGKSKGGNISNFRALKVGLRMMKGIFLGWKRP